MASWLLFLDGPNTRAHAKSNVFLYPLQNENLYRMTNVTFLSFSHLERIYFFLPRFSRGLVCAALADVACARHLVVKFGRICR